jgi:hypothetical protein
MNIFAIVMYYNILSVIYLVRELLLFIYYYPLYFIILTQFIIILYLLIKH